MYERLALDHRDSDAWSRHLALGTRGTDRLVWACQGSPESVGRHGHCSGCAFPDNGVAAYAVSAASHYAVKLAGMPAESWRGLPNRKGGGLSGACAHRAKPDGGVGYYL